MHKALLILMSFISAYSSYYERFMINLASYFKPSIHYHALQVLQTECSVLRDSLSEFTRWVRQKVQVVEEDMDIFKVVYSLHGSLSQVTAIVLQCVGVSKAPPGVYLA